ncbi:MAG: DUF3710 domain-containing protein [Propionicimonas sp.]
MKFGRNRGSADEAPEEPILDTDLDEAAEIDQADELEAIDDELDEDAAEEVASFDDREDGPFDIDEVELTGDEVQRIDLGTLILTPWQGMNLQLQVHEASKQVRAVTGIWRNSGIEVALFAAPASGGLAAEQQEELTEQAQAAGGTAEVAAGPFGPELRRILPQTGPKGEQLFHVSRIWFAEGPRWLLRGTLMGEAALPDGDAKARPFVEFFRNLIVRRGSKPMVPGELVTMDLPTQGNS